MKKMTISLTMLLMAWLMMPGNASAKTELNPSLSVGWGGEYVTVDGWTATFTDAWQGAASFWLQGWDAENNVNVPADYSAYDYFVVEFTQPLNAGVQLTIEDGTWASSNTTKGKADAGAKMLTVKLANASIDLTNVQQAYFQNAGANLTFTIKSVWLGTEDDLAAVPSDLSLYGWSKWNGDITMANDASGQLSVDFGTVKEWSGVSKWLGAFDASDYEYLVFEMAPGTKECEVNAFIAYVNPNGGDDVWQTQSVAIQTTNNSTYVKIPLDADMKSGINQLGFQNKDANGANFTVKTAYWVKKATYAPMNNWWLQGSNGIPEADRVVFANFPEYDYMVFEFAEATTQSLVLTPYYGGTLNDGSWTWVQTTDADKVTTNKNLLVAFVPIPKYDYSSLSQIGAGVAAADGGDVTQYPTIYCATAEYLTQTKGYTSQQLASHIYATVPAPDYLDLPMAAIQPTDGVSVTSEEAVITCGAFDDWNTPSTATRRLGWLFGNGASPAIDAQIEKMLQWLPEFDYVAIEFSRPTSAPMEMYPVLYDANQTPVAAQSFMADPFCKTYFIPLPKTEAEVKAVGVFLSLKPYSITHVARVYLAKKSYLTDRMQFTEEQLASGIFGQGETVTVGATGYATIYFDDTFDRYIPGGIQGFDYTFDADNATLNEAFTFEPDAKVIGNKAIVLKAVDDMALPYTYYFPKADTELEGEGENANSCLYGTSEAQMTFNQSGYNGNVFYYKLSTLNGENVGFYWGAEDGGPFMNGAKKAYLILPQDGAAASGYVFDTVNGLVSTGIRDIVTESDSHAPAYNLAGQRVGKSFRGIVIQNGKKIIK